MRLFDILFLTGADTFFLILIAVIGIRASFDDAKIGRVRNKLIIRGLVLGLAGYLCLFLFALLSHRLRLYYFRDVFRNLCVSWLIAYLIWYIGLWSAGDAKLYMLFSFLLPLEYYGEHIPLFFFPSFIILVNAFIFVLLFVLLETLTRIVIMLPGGIRYFFQHHRELLAKICGLKDKIKGPKAGLAGFFKVVLGLLCIFLAMNIAMVHLEYFKKELIRAFPVLTILNDLSCILFILLFRPFSSFIRKVRASVLYWLSFGLLVYTLMLIFWIPGAYLAQLGRMAVSFTGFMLLILIFTQVIELYIEKNEEKQVEIKDITAGARLTKESAVKFNAYLKGQGGGPEKFYSDGLTSQQVRILQEAGLKNPELSLVRIYKHFPLAPFIFLGVAATVIQRGAICDLQSFKMVFSNILGRIL